MENICKTISLDLQSKIDKLLVQGIEIKGFKFEDKFKLEEFIKTRCKCIEYQDFNKKIYYIDETPFMVHYLNDMLDLNLNPFIDNKDFNISFNYGSYAFV